MTPPTRGWLPRWSRLRLRTKGLIVVILPVIPALFFCLILAVPLMRYGVAGPTARDLPAPQRHAVAVAQYTILFGSLGCIIAGLFAALAVGNSLRRRIELLALHATRLAQADIPPDVDFGPDEIGELAGRVRDAARLLRERDEALRHATRAFDQFFHLSQDLFCIARFDGYFERLNYSWEQVFGYTAAELISKPFVEWVHPDDRDRTIQETATLAGGAGTVSFQNRYRCKDGSYRWLLWAARSVPGEQRIYASARDITEQLASAARREQLNTTLRHQAAALEATNHELEAFSYSVSHDLRAPLRAIDGFSQVLEEEQAEALGEPGRAALGRVRAAAKRMATLIDDLLNLSRLTRMDMQRGRVDVSAIAGEIVDELRAGSPNRQVDVTIAPALVADGDPRMVRIVLQNLLDNAWKYTGRTNGARIELRAVCHGDTTGYAVSDNGAGFDMKYADKLFGAFQRLHSDRDFIGTGIGLAIVQRIAHRHGGSVWAEGEVGRGATFGFTLGEVTAGTDTGDRKAS